VKKCKGIVKNEKIDFIVLCDNKENSLTKAFKVESFPTKFLIDPDGFFLTRPYSDHDTKLGLKMIDIYLEDKYF
jgi:hypothetical protein